MALWNSFWAVNKGMHPTTTSQGFQGKSAAESELCSKGLALRVFEFILVTVSIFSVLKTSCFLKEIYYDRNIIYYDSQVPMQIPGEF